MAELPFRTLLQKMLIKVTRVRALRQTGEQGADSHQIARRLVGALIGVPKGAAELPFQESAFC
jgi:hypothetical protein